jgi:hypothetical protein
MKDATYWEALDEVCTQAGAVYQPGYSIGKDGLALIAAAKENYTGGRSGPVSVKMDTVTKARMLRPWGPGQRLTVDLECQLIFFWEDRLPLLSMGGEVRKVTLPDGRVIAHPAGTIAMSNASRGRPFEGFSYRASDLGDGVNKLSSMEGVVRVTAAAGPNRQIQVQDVLSEGEKTGEGEDGLRLTVSRNPATDNKEWGEGGAVQLSIRATRDGKPTDVPIGAGEKCGVFLIDPQGNRHPATQVIVARGGPDLMGLGEDAVPPREGVSLASTTVTATFAALAKLDGKWSLLFVYPGDTQTKEYPFTIKDVPLP